eukprot:COSAG02_NODE_21696_length_778_cov_1.050074_1_plen_168_part_00
MRGREQGLHRDAGVFAWDTKVLGLEIEISTIWALHDFTEEVGATRIVPRSHRWPKYRQPKAEECYQAVMPKGSCIIYSGTVAIAIHADNAMGHQCVTVPRCVIGDVFHSAAANETPNVKRWGLNVDYCPAFITEEEIESEHPGPPLQSTASSTIPQMRWTISTVLPT